MFRLYLVLLAATAVAGCDNHPQSTLAGHTDSSWALLPFTKGDAWNPVITPDTTMEFTCPVLKRPIRWEAKDVFNPAAVLRGDTVFLLYRAEDLVGKYAGTSRIGLAWSTDGVHFKRNTEPVLYPANDAQKRWEWEGGCEDPRVVQDEKGMYYMTYTAYDGDKARLMVASSPDLYRWTKHGLVFQKAFGGKYAYKWSKSGSIVSSYAKGTPVAQRINGKYWMFWGDQNIWAATSDDLVNWTPVTDSSTTKPSLALRGIGKEFTELKPVLIPRSGRFDSDLVESGPPAMITSRGIVLLYNSRNIREGGDTALPEGTYAAGQALLDLHDPTKVLDRMENSFMKPDKPYEISGQVNHVCFVEGLVKLKDQWLLYYGTADSKIAVAMKK